MYWNSFAVTSNIDALLDQPDLTVEQLFDEPELLQQTKAPNAKLAAFWAQPRVAARLLQFVLGRAPVTPSSDESDEWLERALFKYPFLATEVIISDPPGLLATLFDHTHSTLQPFWDVALPLHPDHPLSPIPHHSHPLFSKNVHQPPCPASHAPLFPYPSASRSTSPASDPATPRELGPGRNVLLSYWAKVVLHLLSKRHSEVCMALTSPLLTTFFASKQG